MISFPTGVLVWKRPTGGWMRRLHQWVFPTYVRPDKERDAARQRTLEEFEALRKDVESLINKRDEDPS